MGILDELRKRRAARQLVVDAIHDEIRDAGNGADLGYRVEARLRDEYDFDPELLTLLLRLLVIVLPLFIKDRATTPEE